MTADPRHVLFRAAGERFALPLEAVREVVVPQPPFARVPHAAVPVRGAMNLRGRVVAVVDLARLLGIVAAGRTDAQEHLILLDRGRRGIGILVGPVLGVEELPSPSPVDVPHGAPVVRGITVSEARGTAITVLDPDALEAHAAALFGAST